jgi:hypothetical protein
VFSRKNRSWRVTQGQVSGTWRVSLRLSLPNYSTLIALLHQLPLLAVMEPSGYSVSKWRDRIPERYTRSPTQLSGDLYTNTRKLVTTGTKLSEDSDEAITRGPMDQEKKYTFTGWWKKSLTVQDIG